MNANELADWLNDPLGYKMGEIATMLRQQQAEIEALRSLSLRKENLGYFYDLHARQQAEIEALKAEKEKLFMGMLDMALDAEIKDLKNGN